MPQKTSPQPVNSRPRHTFAVTSESSVCTSRCESSSSRYRTRNEWCESNSAPSTSKSATSSIAVPSAPRTCPSEYVQLTLSIPGSAVLQGESYYAKLRIDDDDFDDGTCAQFL